MPRVYPPQPADEQSRVRVRGREVGYRDADCTLPARAPTTGSPSGLARRAWTVPATRTFRGGPLIHLTRRVSYGARRVSFRPRPPRRADFQTTPTSTGEQRVRENDLAAEAGEPPKPRLNEGLVIRYGHTHLVVDAGNPGLENEDTRRD